MVLARRAASFVFAAALLGAAPALARQPSEAQQAAARTSFSGNYLAGRIAGAQRDVDAAAAYFRAALRSEPRNPQLLERTFLLSVAEGDGDEAMKLAERVIAVDPGNRVARLALAVRAIKARQFVTARTHLNAGAKGPLADLTVNLVSAWAWLGSDDAGKAIEAIDKLQGADFFGTFREYHAGLVSDLAGRKDDAKRRYAAALTGDGSALRIAQAVAAFRARSGDKAGALAAIAEFEKVVPRHPLMKEARAAIEAGKEPPRPVAGVVDGVAEVLYGIGGALARQGGEDLSIVYLQLALYLTPNHPMALVTLADLYDQLNQHADAIDAYDSVPASSPLKRNADIQTAIDLDRLNRTQEGKDKLNALISADPNDQEAIVALGNIERAREQFSEAAATYSRAVAMLTPGDKSQWSLFYVRGIAYERSKDWPKAEADLKTALELYPDQPLVMNYLGYSWIDRGLNLDEGVKLIRRAVELRPDDGYIVDSLGWAHYRLGKFEDAVRELERAVELRPQDPVMNDHLGDAYWRTGRQLEARFQWSHAKDLSPEPDELKKIEAKLKDGLPDEPATNAAEVEEKKNGG